ncbi:MAG: CPBP family intramembrane metalloprotease [Oscillospiraceae bacterium]|nr:CPBP family intramembrane metalloprotease [Oscillospiraceae bacterium]
MIDWKLKQTQPLFQRILQEPDARLPEQPIVLCVFFCAVLVFTQMTASCILMAVRYALQYMGKGMTLQTDTALFTYLNIIGICGTLIVCRMLENRSFRSMGITKRHIFRDYALGAAIGFAMMSLSLGGLLFSGALRFDEFQPDFSVLRTVFYFCGWMLQGFHEELAFRGWFMFSYGTKHTPWKAVFWSSIIFMSAHLGNHGISFIACCNLTLFGIVMAILLLRTDSIWVPAALHSVWNWAQGNFYGIPVSGIVCEDAVCSTIPNEVPDILSGGAFGAEGSICTTVILIVAVGICLCIPQRKVFSKVKKEI